MSREAKLIVEGNNDELWQRCCGFIDLSLDDFMNIQRRLLLEQLELLKKCKLGRSVMRSREPKTVEDFRLQVPLTHLHRLRTVPADPERVRITSETTVLAAYLRALW